MKQEIKTGQRVTIIEGSSDGHTGIVIEVKQKNRIKVKRDAGGIVDVPTGAYVVHGVSNNDFGVE